MADGDYRGSIISCIGEVIKAMGRPTRSPDLVSSLLLGLFFGVPIPESVWYHIGDQIIVIA